MNPQYSRLACRSIYSQVYTVINTSCCTCYEKWLILQFSAFGFRFSYDICIKFTQDPVSESLKILYPSLSRSCIGFSQDHVSEPLKIMCQILSRSCIRFSRDIVSKSLKIMYRDLSRFCIRVSQDHVSDSLIRSSIIYKIGK
jgi:hypothetical protein